MSEMLALFDIEIESLIFEAFNKTITKKQIALASAMMNLLILHGVEFEAKLYKKYFVQFRAILKNLPNVPVASVKVAEPIAKIEAVVEVEAVEVAEVEAVVVAEVEAVVVAEVAEVEAVEVAEVEAVVVAEVEAEAIKEPSKPKEAAKIDDDDSDDEKDKEEVASDSEEEPEADTNKQPKIAIDWDHISDDDENDKAEQFKKKLLKTKKDIIPPIIKNKYDDVIIINDQKKASAFIRSIIPPEVFKTQRGEDAKPVSVFVQNVIDKENENYRNQ